MARDSDAMMKSKNVLIMGTDGKEFHVFHSYYQVEKYNVVLFVSLFVPQESKYPGSLAGSRYTAGIPIVREGDLSQWIYSYKVDEVVFACNDVRYEDISQKEKIARLAGADFKFAEVTRSMLESDRKVIAVCSVRPQCGKTRVSNQLAKILTQMQKKVAICKYPQPGYDLLIPVTCSNDKKAQKLYQGYLDSIALGVIVYSGINYRLVLPDVERESEVIIWDSSRNDIPFIKPDLYITLCAVEKEEDWFYYPGRINLEMANLVLLVSKEDDEKTSRMQQKVRYINPTAKILHVDSSGLFKTERKNQVKEIIEKLFDTE